MIPTLSLNSIIIIEVFGEDNKGTSFHRSARLPVLDRQLHYANGQVSSMTNLHIEKYVQHFPLDNRS